MTILPVAARLLSVVTGIAEVHTPSSRVIICSQIILMAGFGISVQMEVVAGSLLVRKQGYRQIFHHSVKHIMEIHCLHFRLLPTGYIKLYQPSLPRLV